MATSILLDGNVTCIDPILAADEIMEDLDPELVTERAEALRKLTLATSFRCPLGPEPGIAHVILPRGIVDLLHAPFGIYPTQEVRFHTLTFDEQALGRVTFYRLIYVSHERLIHGEAENPTSPCLVKLADSRWIVKNPTFAHTLNIRYNVPIRYGPGVYYESTKNGTSPWTWTAMVKDLWEECGLELNASSILQAWPGLPYDPHGHPENWNFVGVSAYDALNRVLNRLDCALRCNPTVEQDQFSIVELGAADAAFEAATVKHEILRLLEDDEPKDSYRAGVPYAVRVFFRMWGGEHHEAHTEEIIGPYPDYTDLAIVHAIWDDMHAIKAGDGSISNEDELADRAKERKDKFYQRLVEGGSLLHRVYAGPLADFLPGSLCKGVAWLQNDEGAFITEVMNRDEWPVYERPPCCDSLPPDEIWVKITDSPASTGTGTGTGSETGEGSETGIGTGETAGCTSYYAVQVYDDDCEWIEAEDGLTFGGDDLPLYEVNDIADVPSGYVARAYKGSGNWFWFNGAGAPGAVAVDVVTNDCRILGTLTGGGNDSPGITPVDPACEACFGGEGPAEMLLTVPPGETTGADPCCSDAEYAGTFSLPYLNGCTWETDAAGCINPAAKKYTAAFIGPYWQVTRDDGATWVGGFGWECAGAITLTLVTPGSCQTNPAEVTLAAGASGGDDTLGGGDRDVQIGQIVEKTRLYLPAGSTLGATWCEKNPDDCCDDDAGAGVVVIPNGCGCDSLPAVWEFDLGTLTPGGYLPPGSDEVDHGTGPGGSAFCAENSGLNQLGWTGTLWEGDKDFGGSWGPFRMRLEGCELVMQLGGFGVPAGAPAEFERCVVQYRGTLTAETCFGPITMTRTIYDGEGHPETGCVLPCEGFPETITLNAG